MIECSKNGAQPVNSFALVAYIPEPLASFLDDLRRELVPGCLPHAHVTILPPRPLAVSPDVAWSQIQSRIFDFSPSDIELGHVEMFEKTEVVYVSIRKGWRELKRMHDDLDTGALAFPEPYTYHPHVTLAQDLEPGLAREVYKVARRVWQEFPRKTFPVETVTFVQNTTHNRWIDLASCTLSGGLRLPPAGRRLKLSDAIPGLPRG